MCAFNLVSEHSSITYEANTQGYFLNNPWPWPWSV